MKLSEIVKVTNAKVLKDYDKDFDVNISTDTRTLKPDDLYLPLRGESFDGEKFIEQAYQKGAVASFCTGEGGDFQVENTLDAYLQLANYRRNKLNLKVIAITGSSGKTTTKELVSSVLAEEFKTFKTPLNHNNEVGLCQTIFETPDDTQMLVLEMGMRGLGEIEKLSRYAQPDISVIANVGTAHIGRLGSRENIAKAKCEIVKFQKGDIFIGHNDELIKNTIKFEGQKIFYSLNDVKILEKKANYSKFEYLDNTYELNVGGDYNIENSLSAIQVGLNCGMSVERIQNGLKKYSPIEKRWEVINAGGYEIINDSYNANPDSMKAFIDSVFELYDNYAIVLGDMGELGKDEVLYHSQLGEYINAHKLLTPNTTIISIGNLSKNITDKITKVKTVHFEKIEDAENYISSNIKKETKIFLKASRSMKFERIIELLD